jgi:hypothetical protein
MRAHRIAVLLLSLGALIASAIVARPLAPASAGCDVRLTIAAKDLQIPPGGWLEASATVENESSTDIVLVEPGDGSESGWRTPVIEWRAHRIEQGRATKAVLEGLGRCGLMNGPDPEREVFVLAPGGSRRFQWPFVMPYLKRPGTYEIALTYTNDPRMPFRGMSPDDPTVKPYRNSTACTVTSNTLRIEVLGEK